MARQAPDLDELERAAQLATAQAAEARRQVATAEAARDERTEQRRRTWWATEGVPAAKAEQGRVAAALGAFRDAVAAGDGAQVLTAYLAYARTKAEAAAFTYTAKLATARTEGVGVDERTVYDVSDVSSRAETFDQLLERTVRDLEQGQGSAYRTAKLQPLRDSLEPV